jgi:hypothetical protein
VVVTPADAGTAVAVAEGTTALGSVVVGADGKATVVVLGLTLPATASATVTVASAQHTPVATRLTVDRIHSLVDLLALALGRYRVTAHLIRADNGVPIQGQPILIDSWQGTFCTAVTDASGAGRCPVPRRLLGAVLLGQVHASYAGSADYLPAEFGAATPPGRGGGHGHGR